MTSGYLNLVLHAHLPYIKHLRYPYHFEQRWLYESIVESYIPMIDALFDLLEKGERFHITLSVSPTLCVMFNDDDLKDGCEAYIHGLTELAERECIKNRDRPEVADLSRWYLDRYRRMRYLYADKYKRDLIGALKRLREEGVMSLCTTSATHAFLPLLEDYPEAINAQIKGGVDIFRRVTGLDPEGFWLPECGYFPAVEEIMKKAGLDFTVLESHGIVFAKPRPSFGVYRPVKGPGGVVLFGRDSAVSQLVWSAEYGYPADKDYRDFYDDVAYDLSDEEAARYIHPDGIRVPSGIKYRRITGRDWKDWYNPQKAIQKAGLHASHFIEEVSGLICRIGDRFCIEPVVTVAFDAELFGHWWHEGCLWLENILSGFSGSRSVKTVPCRHFIGPDPGGERVFPEKSSWGSGGYGDTWINPKNDWMVGYIHHATESMIKLADTHRHVRDGKIIRALNMTAREVLLLQSSDWGFLLTKGSSGSYATKRFTDHYERALYIVDMIRSGTLREDYFERTQGKDGEFVEVDFRLFGRS